MIMESQRNYIYYDVSPSDRSNEANCVIRAISLAMNMDYYEVEQMLYDIGDYYSCEELCVCCYTFLLDNVFKLRHFIGYGKTAGEIAREHPNDILLLRMDGHLSTSLQGEIYDIFDCSGEMITDFWVI